MNMQMAKIVDHTRSKVDKFFFPPFSQVSRGFGDPYTERELHTQGEISIATFTILG